MDWKVRWIYDLILRKRLKTDIITRHPPASSSGQKNVRMVDPKTNNIDKVLELNVLYKIIDTQSLF
jgi:hypothetical protein